MCVIFVPNSIVNSTAIDVFMRWRNLYITSVCMLLQKKWWPCFINIWNSESFQCGQKNTFEMWEIALVHCYWWVWHLNRSTTYRGKTRKIHKVTHTTTTTSSFFLVLLMLILMLIYVISNHCLMKLNWSV